MLWVAAFASFYLFPVKYFATYLVAAIVFVVFIYIFFNKNEHIPRIFSTTLATIIGVAFVMNLQFYPGLNPYQSGAVAGRDMKEMKIAAEDILIYKSHKPATDVYSEMIVPRVLKQHQLDSVLAMRNPRYIFTCENSLVEVEEYGLKTKIIKSYDDFHTSTLSLPFLNPKTRTESLVKCYLLKVEY
jgi:hypothetical protein